jgi:L-ascorbate metabolism protein UlaG (beta-lactamase superfamily)
MSNLHSATTVQPRPSSRCTLSVIAFGLMAILISVATSQAFANPLPPSDHFDGEKYFNTNRGATQASSRMTILKRFLFDKKPDTVPANNFEVPRLDLAAWAKLDDNTMHLARLGHSSFLLKLHGKTWLVDPVFSDRCSPVQWMGPKRFHPVPLDATALPAIEGVVISHDHYDHLDLNTINDLKGKVAQFIVPLGVGARLQESGVAKEKIQEFDWWQGTQIGNIKITATPAQHFSGRSLNDRDKTLWASWVFESTGANGSTAKLFYSGDTGYSTDFKKIGDKFGPFDFTLMETGAYDAQWPGVHMTPEETAQAHVDVRGKVLIPVHNGTFDLAFHPWKEPFERITKIGVERQLAVATPEMGVVMTLGQPHPQTRWWEGK